MDEYCEENLCVDPLAPPPTQSPLPSAHTVPTLNSVNSFIDGIFFGLGFICVLLVLYCILQYHWQRRQQQEQRWQ